MNPSTKQLFHPVQKSLDWSEVLAKALKNGGEWAEIFWEKSTSSVLSKKNRQLNDLGSHFDEGVGIRVLIEGKSVYGFTNTLTAEGILNLAQNISQSIKKSGKTKEIPLLAMIQHPLDQKITDLPHEFSLEKKMLLLERLDKKAWADMKEIKQVNSSLSDEMRQIFVVRSDGKVAIDEKSYIAMRCQIIGQGQSGSQNAFCQKGGFWGYERFLEESPESIATETQERLKILLNAKAAPSGTMPVVLSAQAGGTMIHEAVGHGLEADLASEGLSVYSNRVGEKVASEKITVIDDGTVPYKRGSHSFDDEGTPTQKNILIENGVLKTYMFDQKMALRYDKKSTGNARRQNYRYQPMVRMTNTYIAPGTDSPEKILKDTSWGLFVKQMGGGQVDTTSGEFTFAVKEAYLIRNGEIGEAVHGATLIGNGPKVMQDVDAVGKDMGWDMGTCGKNDQGVFVTDAQPTIRIPHLTVGGTVSLKEYFPDR